MNDLERLLGRIYEAFNRRDVDTVLAAMHPAVDWPRLAINPPRHSSKNVRQKCATDEITPQSVVAVH